MYFTVSDFSIYSSGVLVQESGFIIKKSNNFKENITFQNHYDQNTWVALMLINHEITGSNFVPEVSYQTRCFCHFYVSSKMSGKCF
jgi:hypothetical protein